MRYTSTVGDDGTSPELPTNLHHTQQRSTLYHCDKKKGDFETHLVKSHALEVGDASSTINDCGKRNNEL